jgi:hypothetical protein
MYHTLIVGCSYVEMLSPFTHINPNHNENHPDRKLFDTIDHDNFLIVFGFNNLVYASSMRLKSMNHNIFMLKLF